MTTLREHLEAIIVRGYSPTKDDDRADAVAALAILDKDHRYRCGPGCWDCDIQREPWRSTNVRVSIVPDPEAALAILDQADRFTDLYGKPRHLIGGNHALIHDPKATP